MNKLTILLFIFLIPMNSSHALPIYASPGLAVTTSSSSDETASNGKSLYEGNNGIGLEGTLEMDLGLNFSLLGGLNYTTSSGLAQYAFDDPSGPDSASVSDLKSSMANFNALIDLKWNLIKTQKFKLFFGAGLTSGATIIVHDEEDFKRSNNNSKTGYQAYSTASLAGSFTEAGITYLRDGKSGFTILAKKVHSQSGKLETLNNKKLSFDYYQFGINYVNTVNW